MIDINNYENELLLTAGYTADEINEMSNHRRRNLATEIEMELEAIGASI